MFDLLSTTGRQELSATAAAVDGELHPLQAGTV
jgi:hypothetical protein